jgi:hypothetical protein
MGMLSWLFGGADDTADGAGVAPPEINPATGCRCWTVASM